jgi:hypothetical protein
MEPHKPDHWVAGLLAGDEWRGKFHATEEELYEHLEKDCDSDAEALLVYNVIDSMKVYQLWWEKEWRKSDE